MGQEVSPQRLQTNTPVDTFLVWNSTLTLKNMSLPQHKGPLPLTAPQILAELHDPVSVFKMELKY
jgi:hypothetical protein